MKISVLQHAANEGPGEIANWAEKRGYSITLHHLYLAEPLPTLDSFDLLLVMGGEMNIYQHRDYPWLKAESTTIDAAMQQGKKVIGICLGAQLIADALGARVTQNAEYELGWLPVTFTDEALTVFPGLPASATVLHWHGDTFALPQGATRLASSPGCPQQGFVVKKKCLGLQFHLEMNPGLVLQMVEGSNLENWPKGTYVQSPEAILKQADAYTQKNRLFLHAMLDTFVEG